MHNMKQLFKNVPIELSKFKFFKLGRLVKIDYLQYTIFVELTFIDIFRNGYNKYRVYVYENVEEITNKPNDKSLVLSKEIREPLIPSLMQIIKILQEN